MVDDRWAVEGGIERALIETHHLANISGLEEADRARQRLVEAQSAGSLRRTRDHLADAREYLELARLARRDCAAGFAKARDLTARAEAALRFERPVPSSNDPAALLPDGSASRSRPRRSLAELRREAAVNSFEQLRYDVALEEAFAELARRARAGAGHSNAADDGANAADDEANATDDGAARQFEDPGDLDAEEALRLASLEVDIERSLLGSEADAETGFRFLSSDQVASRDRASADES